MAKIEIYTKATCPYCHRAKALLNSKGASFDEIAIDGDADKREKMIARSGRSTVPQSLSTGSMSAVVMIYMHLMHAVALTQCWVNKGGGCFSLSV